MKLFEKPENPLGIFKILVNFETKAEALAAYVVKMRELVLSGDVLIKVQLNPCELIFEAQSLDSSIIEYTYYF